MGPLLLSYNLSDIRKRLILFFFTITDILFNLPCSISFRILSGPPVYADFWALLLLLLALLLRLGCLLLLLLLYLQLLELQHLGVHLLL